MKRYVPERIDLAKLNNDYQVSSLVGFHPDKLKWILSEITEKPLASTGFAEIHTKRFQSYVHNYKDYLDKLAIDGIIERDLSSSYDLLC